MTRLVRLLLFAVTSLLLCGCRTSEVKGGNWTGLIDDVPTGSTQAHYGDGKGDAVGGGGAAPAIDVSDKTKETK